MFLFRHILQSSNNVFFFFFIYRIGCYPIVTAAHQSQGISAKEWIDFVIAGVGAGKGGGKAETANASIPGGNDVMDKVVTLAAQYGESKIAGSVYTAK